MTWWQLWDRASVATHGVSSRGDHETSGWAVAFLLAGVAVAMFVGAWAVLRRPAARTCRPPACGSACGCGPACLGFSTSQG